MFIVLSRFNGYPYGRRCGFISYFLSAPHETAQFKLSLYYSNLKTAELAPFHSTMVKDAQTLYVIDNVCGVNLNEAE